MLGPKDNQAQFSVSLVVALAVTDLGAWLGTMFSPAGEGHAWTVGAPLSGVRARYSSIGLSMPISVETVILNYDTLSISYSVMEKVLLIVEFSFSLRSLYNPYARWRLRNVLQFHLVAGSRLLGFSLSGPRPGDAHGGSPGGHD
jgi:hypothetical protein